MVKVLNFNLKSSDDNEKLHKAKSQKDILNGSINSSEESNSHLGSDLHRKIIRIKNEQGARGFDVKRYQGEPTMNPRPVVN